MSTFYRNRETGRIQAHPKAGIGDSLNSDEVGEDGKVLKPFVSLPITKDKIKKAKSLMVDQSQTTEVNTDSGDSEQEGDQ